MKEIEKMRSKTIAARSPDEFDRLYNATADELSQYEPEVEEFQMGNTMYARFKYIETVKVRESFEDDFMQEGERCHCADCPFLQIGTDARRKTFPCEYAAYGETRMDNAACEVFYREAVKMMRERARS